MLSIKPQKEVTEEIVRIYKNSLTAGPNSVEPNRIEDYVNIRSMKISYPLKHSLLSCFSCVYPCNINCNPRLENEVFISRKDASGLNGFEKDKNKIYTEIGSSFNSICFPRCGDKSRYPHCDKEATIDVRLFSNLTEFEEYYLSRPENLLKKDADFHTESLKMHEALRKVFESIENQEVVKKISAII
jgi:hypothetical protein